MLGETEKDAMKKGMMTLWIMWAAMVGSLIIYLFIVHAVGDEIRKSLHPDFPMELLRNILYGISIITILLSHFLRKFMLAVKNSDASSGLMKYGAQSNQPLFVAKYTMTVMVSLALSESIAIYGLVLFLVGADFQTFYIFTAISALSMFFYRPKRMELEGLAVAMQTKSAS
jgi:hypothetical protein